MLNSRLPKFYKQPPAERRRLLLQNGFLNAEDLVNLQAGSGLSIHKADGMIENVVGVLGLPLAVALNFRINGKDRIIPLAVEEASVVAALSAAAKVLRHGEGLITSSEPPLLIGQVQVTGVANPTQAKEALLQRRRDICDLANSLHPRLIARGGGAQDIEVRLLSSPKPGGDMLVLHLLVATCEAMGANLVNSMCEGVAALVEQISGGRVFLRILSNLTDRALVTARCTIPCAALQMPNFPGTLVRDGIICANDFAVLDPYRAATHNKGIMNGIDAVALACGNDWRAIEAAAHAYAGRGHSYTALTKWSADTEGNLCGELQMPLKVGVVGGNLLGNPTVQIALRLLGDPSARELAEVMAATGLAQNFAALRALTTDGIQQGHMALHARAVVNAVNPPAALYDQVLDKLQHSGEIKVWKAQEILTALTAAPIAHTADRSAPVAAPAPEAAMAGIGFGKAILLGEHAVVYGRRALAVPLPMRISAWASKHDQPGVLLQIPRWGFDSILKPATAHHSLHATLFTLLRELGLENTPLRLFVQPDVPRAMGLGASAALAVAIVRALDLHFALNLTPEQICAYAFAAEKVAHGNPSGIDNSVSTFNQCLLMQADRTLKPIPLAMHLPQPLPLVIALSSSASLTAGSVAGVRRRYEAHPQLYSKLFADIDALVGDGAQALAAGDLSLLGELMNINQGLLSALQVSSAELEAMVQLARRHGALGAKLTGGGVGGAIVALCPGTAEAVVEAMHEAGFRAFACNVPGNTHA